MRRIIYSLYCTYRGILWIGTKFMDVFRWIKAHYVLLGIIAVLLIGTSLSIILPMRFPRIPFLITYLGIIAFSILALSLIFAIAMDRIAETMGIGIKQMAMLRQTTSALNQATLKSNSLMEQNLHLQNALIGKLNETNQLITIAAKEVATATGNLISTLQPH